MSDEPEKKKRPRIQPTLPQQINDPLEYKENMCSKNARPIQLVSYKINSDIWADKHYNIRVQHGDENGVREGIEAEIVVPLIQETFIHVISYALKYGKIMNFPPFSPPRSTRIVLQDLVNAEENFLNVAVEYHFLEVDVYEITIWTAMKEANFKKREGQYIIQLHHDRTILCQYLQGKDKELMCLNRK